MDASNDSGTSPAAFPLLRIWLCGPFRMEWIDLATGQALSAADPTAGSKDRAAALKLDTMGLFAVHAREIQRRQVSIREKRLYRMVRHIHDPQH
jgi:hypothetical protein